MPRAEKVVCGGGDGGRCGDGISSSSFPLLCCDISERSSSRRLQSVRAMQRSGECACRRRDERREMRADAQRRVDGQAMRVGVFRLWEQRCTCNLVCTLYNTTILLTMAPATRSSRATSSKVTLDGHTDRENDSPLTELSEQEQPVQNRVGEGIATIEVWYVKLYSCKSLLLIFKQCSSMSCINRTLQLTCA